VLLTKLILRKSTLLLLRDELASISLYYLQGENIRRPEEELSFKVVNTSSCLSGLDLVVIELGGRIWAGTHGTKTLYFWLPTLWLTFPALLNLQISLTEGHPS